MLLAQLTIERMRINAGKQICFWRGELWIYEGPETGIWRGNGRYQNAYLEKEIHGTVTDANAEAARKAEDDGREPEKLFDETSKLRDETRRYICSMPGLDFTGEWDSHGLVPLANGLFDPGTRTLTPYAPEHRVTYKFAAPYDPAATFAHGEQMIRDLFVSYGADESEKYVWLIRQFAYVALFKNGRQIGRQLRRCVYLHGEKNSGKSQLVILFREAIGKNHACATSLDQLSDLRQARFALERLMDAVIWAADEVASEKTQIDAIRVKALLSEGIVNTDAKGKAAIEKQFLGAAIFSSNSFPKTIDSASGFADRFMLVNCRAVFDNEAPRGVALTAKEQGFSSPADFVVATELAGFVNWALGARDHIEKNMVFEQPAAVVRAREDIADRSSPVRAFLKLCVEAVPLDQASRSGDIYEAFRELHFEENGRDTKAIIARNFWNTAGAHYGGMRGLLDRRIWKHEDATVAAGLKLTDEGLDYWRAAKTRKNAGEPNMQNMADGGVIFIDKNKVDAVMSYFGAPPEDKPKTTNRPRF